MGKTLQLRTSRDLTTSVTMATSVLLRSYYNLSSLSDNMARDARDSNRSFKTYTIPRKERRPSEDFQFTLPVDSREAKEIEHAVRRLTWDTNILDKAVSVSHIKKVDNPGLEREYHEKRTALREEGRSPKELTQQLAFGVETEDTRVKEICRLGLECDGVNHTLGDGGMGVTVWKCPDLCLRALSWPTSGAAYLVVYKIVKGRVKPVTPKLSAETPNLEPTPNYDCHLSRNMANSSITDLSTLMRSTQYYLYEYNDEGLPSKRPRHCLPFAVIHLKKNESTTGEVMPTLPVVKPASPVKEPNRLNEDMKTSSFRDDDGILAWRGLVTSNDKSLGYVSLLAGHKLGLNFWKSYLDVSRKIPLRQLSLMLPGDVKSAWKSPLKYRNHVLSLCTMKPAAPRQPSEKFSNFTRHLAIKAKAAGVLCIDSFTTLFLVPSCKLAMRLGFCTAERPPRMFCIVCRRHSTLLSPTSAWPQAFPVTSPAGSQSAPASHTGIPTETVTAAVRPASLDFKAQHRAKIVVSSPENNLHKRRHPRQIAKRSQSFSFSPLKDANKSSLRISRSASTSERDGFRDGNSELKLRTPDRFLESQAKCNDSSRECERFSCPGSQLKLSLSTHNASKECVTMKQSQLTPPTAREVCHESLCAEEKPSSCVTGGRKYDVSLPSISLTKAEFSVRSPASCVIPSPCNGGLSPVWPDSPIVFSSGSDKSPFLYDASLQKEERAKGNRRLSANSGDNWRFGLSQSRDDLSRKMRRLLTRRDVEADSTPRILMGSPFRASEENSPQDTKLTLENWTTTSSFLSDKQALRSLRKAAALQKGPNGRKSTESDDDLQSTDMEISELSNTDSKAALQKGPQVHNSTESYDDLQTIDMEISEPSNTDSSNLTNLGVSKSLDKEAMGISPTPVQDDLHCVDMEISESAECPIILSHSFSCAPLEPLHDSSSSYSIHLASGITPFAGGKHSGGSTNKHAHDSMESSLLSNVEKISELPLSGVNNPENTLKKDAGASVVQRTTLNVDVYPKSSESGGNVDSIDMDIADDGELLSNTVEFEGGGYVQPTPNNTAGELDVYNANSSVDNVSPKEGGNDHIEIEGSLGIGSYLSKEHVLGTREDRMVEVGENTASWITTDHSNKKLPNKRRSYSCLTSPSEQDIDASVLNHLEQKPKHTASSMTSQDASQMTCSPLPSKKNPSTCSLTNRKAIRFALPPKKSTKVIARLQNNFTVETNCDQSSDCSSNEVSTEHSCIKSTTDQRKDSIGIIKSDDSASMNESRDCKPLAVSCTASERDNTDYPEHADSHLGGVIETSLFQDWGVTEDSLIGTDHDGCTEVYDFASQADQALEPIETWPVIDDGDFHFPDPEIAVCSPLNSIETFTFRFPGESGCDEDEDELTPRETRTTEEETVLVEERFLGFFMGPEVVICSDGNSEAIVTPSEELDSAASPSINSKDEASAKRAEFKTKGFQCEDSETTDKRSLVVSVSTSSGEELAETLGFEGEDLNIAGGSRPVDRQCIRTDSCNEGCTEKLSQFLAPQSSSKQEHKIQSEKSVVFREVEPAKGGDASLEVSKTEFPCQEELKTAVSDYTKTVENQREEAPCEVIDLRDHASETRGVKTSLGNEAEQKFETVNCPGKLTCSMEVNMSKRLAGNMAERGEKVTLLCPAEFPTVVSHRGNSIERVQALKIPNDLPDTRVDPQQDKKLPGCDEPITVPKTHTTDNTEVEQSSDNKQSTATLNHGLTSTTLSYPLPIKGSNNLQCNRVNKPTDYTSTKDLPLGPVESSAKIVTNGKPVEETIRTKQFPGATLSQQRFFKTPRTDSQECKTKGNPCDSSDRDCLRGKHDLQRDHRVLNGKRKLVTEPGNMAKRLKLSLELPSAPEKSREVDFRGNRLYRHHMERGQSKNSQAEYGKQSSSSYWMAPSLPVHLPARNGERGGLPRVVPSDPPWYPQRAVTNHNWFEGVYPSPADCGRATFVPTMYRARPMFSSPGTVPGTWQLPGNSCHMTYPLLGRR